MALNFNDILKTKSQQSACDDWNSLPIVIDKACVDNSPTRRTCTDTFLNIFKREGCHMVEMSCAKNEAHSANMQFLTHTVDRMLATQV